MIDYNEYRKLNKKLILPLDRMKKIINKIKLQKVKNYGLVLKKDTFKVFDKYCELPKSLVVGYAMALCLIGKAKNIYLAGFDGYENNEPLNEEMNSYLINIKKNLPKLKFFSLTPTSYSISKKLIV